MPDAPKFQVVNGGQTIRALNRARSAGTLKSDVLVSVRVIDSEGDKQFASDVTVNQNNQNPMKTGFMRSTDEFVVQLANSLASKGWYFERRAGEVKNATTEEISRIEHRIGCKITGKVIKLKEGTQAYVATFFRHPEMAKKNPKKMFQSDADGGYFERIFCADMTAEKMITSVQILAAAEGFVQRFVELKRKRPEHGENGNAWKEHYRELLGDHLVDDHGGILEQAIPQSAIFLCATIFQDWTDLLGKPPSELPTHLTSNGKGVMRQHLTWIFDFAKDNPETIEMSWPNMMKSNTFVGKVVAYIKGIHSKSGRAPARGGKPAKARNT